MPTYAAAVRKDNENVVYPMLVVVPDGPDDEERALMCVKVTVTALRLAEGPGSDE